MAATTAKRPAWRRLLFWALAIIVAAAFANLVGWDIRGWLSANGRPLAVWILAAGGAYLVVRGLLKL